MFVFLKLLGRIKERGLTQGQLAKLISISSNSLSSKLKGRSQFNPIEISNICHELDISNDEIGDYFFTPKV